MSHEKNNDKLAIKMDEKHFYIGETSKDFLAEMTYFYSGEKEMTVNHTGVSESLKGLGIGQKLVDAVVAYARQHQLTIVPTCPYAIKVMTTNPIYADVLKK